MSAQGIDERIINVRYFIGLCLVTLTENTDMSEGMVSLSSQAVSLCLVTHSRIQSSYIRRCGKFFVIMLRFVSVYGKQEDAAMLEDVVSM